MAKKKPAAPADGDANESTFEESIDRLESVVEKLEAGELDMDESLAAYEAGIRHLQRCHTLLSAAEEKVRLLTDVDADGAAATAPFDADQPASFGDSD